MQGCALFVVVGTFVVLVGGQPAPTLNGGQTLQDIANTFSAQPVDTQRKTEPANTLSSGGNFLDQCEEQWNFKNPCTPDNLARNITIFPYPYTNNKFLMCGDFGKLYVVHCPRYEIYHKGCRQCVSKGSKLTTACEVHDIPLSETVVSNPCTHEAILADKLFFPFPNDLGKYIHCDAWGKAWEMICTPGEVWDQYKVACVNPVLMNPCVRSLKKPGFLYKHPCDPYKYIRCDDEFIPYEIPCAGGDVFSETNQVCQSPRLYQTPPKHNCGNYTFRFRSYASSSYITNTNQQLVNSASALNAGPIPASGSFKTGGDINTLVNVWTENVKPSTGAAQSGMHLAPTVMNQAATGMDLASTGMNQASTGMHQASTGMNQASTGMDLASTGMNQASTGMNQASTEMDLAYTGMNLASASTGASMSGMGQGIDIGTGSGAAGVYVSPAGQAVDSSLQGSSTGQASSFIVSSDNLGNGEAFGFADMTSGAGTAGMSTSKGKGSLTMVGDFASSKGDVATGIVNSAMTRAGTTGGIGGSSSFDQFGTVEHSSPIITVPSNQVDSVYHRVRIGDTVGQAVDSGSNVMVDVKPLGIHSGMGGIGSNPLGVDTHTSPIISRKSSNSLIDMTAPGIDIKASGVDMTAQGIDMTSSGVDMTVPGVDMTASGIDMTAPGISGIDDLTSAVTAMMGTSTTPPDVSFATSAGFSSATNAGNAGSGPNLDKAGFGQADTTNSINGQVVKPEQKVVLVMPFGTPSGNTGSVISAGTDIAATGTGAFDTSWSGAIDIAPLDSVGAGSMNVASLDGTDVAGTAIYDITGKGTTNTASFNSAASGSTNADTYANADTGMSGTGMIGAPDTGSASGATFLDSTGTSPFGTETVLHDTFGINSTIAGSASVGIADASMFDPLNVGPSGDAAGPSGTSYEPSGTTAGPGLLDSIIYDLLSSVTGGSASADSAMSDSSASTGTASVDSVGTGQAGVDLTGVDWASWGAAVDGIVASTQNTGSTGATVYDNVTGGLSETAGVTGTGSADSIVFDSTGSSISAGGVNYDSMASGATGAADLGASGALMFDTAGAGIYDSVAGGATGDPGISSVSHNASMFGNSGSTITGSTGDVVYDSVGGGATGTTGAPTGSFSDPMFGNSGSALTGSTGDVIYDTVAGGSTGSGGVGASGSANSLMFDASGTSAGTTGGSSGTVNAGFHSSSTFDSTGAVSGGAPGDFIYDSATGTVDFTGFGSGPTNADISAALDSTTGSAMVGSIFDRIGSLDHAGLRSLVGTLFDGLGAVTEAPNVGTGQPVTEQVGSTAAYDSSANAVGTISQDQFGASSGFGTGAGFGNGPGSNVFDVGAGGADQFSPGGSTGTGFSGGADTSVFGQGVVDPGLSAAGGNTIDVVIDPSLVGNVMIDVPGAGSGQTSVGSAGTSSAVDFGVSGTQFQNTDGSRVPVVELPPDGAVSGGVNSPDTTGVGLHDIMQMGNQVGGQLVETAHIHPSLLRDYMYSERRFADPCTKQNLKHHRTHFKLRDNPHSFIQCDQEGIMYVMKCSGYLLFDVVTRSCYDKHSQPHLGQHTSANMIVK